MLERDIDRIIELEQRLPKCQYLIFDASDTLVYDDPAYLQELTLETIRILRPHQETNLEIYSASAIYPLAEALGFTTSEFWSTFRQVRYRKDIKDDYQSIKVFSDTIALRSLQDKTLLMVTHAPLDLALAYQRRIYEQTGVEIKYLNTPYRYEQPYSMLKPNRRLLDDLVRKADFIHPDQNTDEILHYSAVIGDDPRDIRSGHNVGAVSVLVKRKKNSLIRPDEPFLEFKNLFHFAHSFKS